MANVQISDLALATIPLDLTATFFEVQTVEGGVDVSRKVAGDNLTFSIDNVITGTSTDDPAVVAGTFDGVLTYRNLSLQQTGSVGFSPAGDDFIIQNFAEGGDLQLRIRDGTILVQTLPAASGGLQVNNTLTGAGLERVLTLSDLSAGGQVNTVVGGVNITVDASDPVNPIANLDAAITGVSVDGVTLTTAGAATNFLDETGSYSVPAGGASDLNALTDVTLAGVAANDLFFRGAADWNNTGELTWNPTTKTLNISGNTAPLLTLSPTGGVVCTLRASESFGTTNFTIGFPGVTGLTLSEAGSLILGDITGVTGSVNIGMGTGDLVTFTADTSNTLELNFVTPNFELENQELAGGINLRGRLTAGTFVNLITADPDADVALFNIGVETARTDTLANGGFFVNNTVTGAGFERALTTSDIGGVTFPIDALDNEQIRWGTGQDVLQFFDGTDMFFNAVVGVDYRFRGGTGGTDTMLALLSDGAVDIYFDGTIAFSSISQGITVGPGPAAGDGRIDIVDGGGDSCSLFMDNAGQMIIRTNAAGDDILFTVRNGAGSANEIALLLVADGGVQLYYNNIEHARTAAGAAGGPKFEIFDDVDFRKVYGTQTVKKSSPTSRNTTTTLTADPDLTVSIGTAGNYKIEVWLLVQAANATPDISVGLDWDGAVNDDRGQLWFGPDTTAGASGTGLVQYDTLDSTPVGLAFGALFSTTSAHLIYCTCVFDANGTGTIAVHWAQAVSDAGNTIVLAQSRMEVTRLEN